MQDRIFTLHPGERAVVYTTPARRVLNSREWEALESSEQIIFKGEHGYISYTDVIPREDSSFAAEVWDYAYTQMDAGGEFEGKTPDYCLYRVAARVARALAMLVFGQEFLLK
jgi:hypothetical protein